MEDAQRRATTKARRKALLYAKKHGWEIKYGYTDMITYLISMNHAELANTTGWGLYGTKQWRLIAHAPTAQTWESVYETLNIWTPKDSATAE